MSSYLPLLRVWYFLVCPEANLEEYLDFICLQSKVAKKGDFGRLRLHFSPFLGTVPSMTPFPPLLRLTNSIYVMKDFQVQSN